MELNILPTDYLHKITEAKISISNGKHKLKWTYTKADGFFVVGYAYDNENLNCMEYVADILRQCESEKAIKHKANGTFLTSFTRANVTSNGVEIGDKNEFQMPMVIKVFPYEIIDGVIVVYDQDDGDNTAVIQYVIKYSKKQATGIKALLNPKETIKVSNFEGFFTGLLYYTVLNSSVKYPINDNMVNREFDVPVSKGLSVDIKVEEKYRSLFKCISE